MPNMLEPKASILFLDHFLFIYLMITELYVELELYVPYAFLYISLTCQVFKIDFTTKMNMLYATERNTESVESELKGIGLVACLIISPLTYLQYAVGSQFHHGFLEPNAAPRQYYIP